MFVAGTETTALTLTWLWLLLDAHPAVLARVTEEVAAVIGTDVPQQHHLPALVQTRMALQEVNRLYPVGWILPRTLAQDDAIGGVPMRAGSTVLISPYLTHRLPGFWPEPLVFDPQRFADGSRPRSGYVAFGAGDHRCLGEHFAQTEVLLAVAATLSRFRPEIVRPQSIRARATTTLRPTSLPRMRLHPR